MQMPVGLTAAASFAVSLRPPPRGRRRVHRGQVVAQALKDSLAQNALVGDAAVFDLRLDHRFDPRRFRLLDRHRQRRAFDDQRIEPFAHLARHRLGVAAARLASVYEPIPIAAADVKRGDLPGTRAELLDKRDDGESVALGAFELEPALLPPGTVGSIAPLGDDPLEAELAGMTKEGIAVVH